MLNITSKSDLVHWLKKSDPAELQELYDAAYQVKLEHVGKNVYMRGIVEFSNICAKNCFYCGIRLDNTNVSRYSMTEDEILATVRSAVDLGYTSVVLQSGERKSGDFTGFVDSVVKKIKAIDNGAVGITLSVGEQDRDTFQRWFDSGAHRYLLRIETSNPKLYARLHPDGHDYVRRLGCLAELREIGYQVGTGVMMGLPFQTEEDMSDDILFFKEHDIDMIGMGPYIVHRDTPLGQGQEGFAYDARRNFDLGLKMIALTRIMLKDVNIAAATALQALDAEGRERGLRCGANIIMPNVTPVKFREGYQLYEGKPCMDENAKMCSACLASRVASVGENIVMNQWGDSPHFFKRNKPS